MKKQFLVLMTVFGICSVTLAQRMELSDPNQQAVTVESAAISTEISGRIAVTTYDLVFMNPNNRVLEGSFEFPLLDGQSVVRFGLDINGKLREAVPVEKPKARAVFEQIERRRVDPGLLEQTAGNNYRARVFPLPANGTRRILIAVQEDLTPKAELLTYRLGLDFPQPLKHFKLDLRVHGRQGQDVKASTTLDLKLPAWREDHVVSVEQSNFKAKGLLELELPKLLQVSSLVQQLGEKSYFYSYLPIQLGLKTRSAPKHLGILWDSSSSAKEGDHDSQLELLEATFKALPDLKVSLVRVRHQVEAPKPFTVQKGNWDDLRNELKATVYDGGTSLDGLVDVAGVDEWLFFSDGLLNFGATQKLNKLPLRAPVHAINASLRSNPSWLRGIAQRNSGEFVDLRELKAGPAAALLRQASPRLLAIEAKPDELTHIYPELGTPLVNDTFAVAGILRSKSSTLRIKVGHDDLDGRWIELKVDGSHPNSQLAARAWAVLKLGTLSLDAEANRDDMRRTAQEFGIATADTSLIVLEALDDYVRFDIQPPEELLAEWRQHQGQRRATELKDVAVHLDRIARLLSEKEEWYKKDFPKGALPKEESGMKKEANEVVHLSAFAVADSSARGGQAGRPRNGSTWASAPAAAAPAPPPPMLERMAVTGAGAARQEGSRQDGMDPSFEPSSSTIVLEKWSPSAGYLDRMRKAGKERWLNLYLEERHDHAKQPGFFLDVADFLLEKGEMELGLRVLSNLAELQLEDVALLRVLGMRLVQAKRADLALPMLERVLELRPDEPQSYRDLALACSELGRFQRAVDLLWSLVSKPWEGRFPEVELIALAELNSIVATCGQKLDLGKVDSRLLKPMPLGLRAVLTWDANDCDIDLWVVDPNGQACGYSAPLSYQGGRMSKDFTGGYGPEEFSLKAPKPGKYAIRINYFGDNRQNNLGPVTAQVHLFTNFGKSTQKKETITVRLSATKEDRDIGSIEIK